MESNTFYDIYLEELKNLPQGTPEEETALLKKLTEGDKTAASRLTELKLAKAVQIAEEYHDRGLPAGDLVQEANMALFLFASEYENGDFDAQMEKKVRAAIEDALQIQNRETKIEEEMAARVNVLKDISASMARELGREATLAELAERMKMTEEDVREIMKISQDPVSLETPIGEEEDSHLGDFIPDEGASEPSEAASFTLLKEQLMDVLSTLTPREEKVLKLRFGIEDGRTRTLEEVGKEFNVTRERIRQIEAKALRKLRHPSRSKKLKDFLN